MPIYEYACGSCGHVFDILQKMDAKPLRDCPECGKPELKKLLSAPNFRLKGGGWYETDFKKENQRNLAGDPPASPQKKEDGQKDGNKADKDKSGQTGSGSKSGASGAKED